MLISFHPPSRGTGSPVILDRHLKRLEIEGWKISIAIPENFLKTPINLPQTWQIIPLISRKWWWPPYRANISLLVNIRLFLWKNECEKILSKNKPTAILAFLCDVYPLLAVNLSKSLKIPLSVIVHDQEEAMAKHGDNVNQMRQRAAHVLKHASRVWTVSRELGDVYKIIQPKKLSVLFPIPEQFTSNFIEWKSDFKTNPVVAHAGRLHPFQLPNLNSLAKALKKVNGVLLLVTDRDNPTLLNLLTTHSNVKWQETFYENSEVIKFLGERASCILVSYSYTFSEQPWASTSFPSKLIEFSPLGLPILILAPQFAAVSNWAKSHHWLGHIETLDESLILEYLLTKLIVKDNWLEMSKQTQRVALTEFHPDQIQSQFEAELAVNTSRF